MNFNSHTDVVIRVAVELVNLLTPGEDRGHRYVPVEGDERTAAVGVVLRGAGGREATWEEAAGLCFVAAELRGVFEAVSAGAVDDAARRVNALLIRTGDFVSESEPALAQSPPQWLHPSRRIASRCSSGRGLRPSW